MAVIDPIYNGEGGAAVRAKLNELIDTVNSGSTTINVGDAPLYDPSKAGGYEAGSIVSYKNESSPDPEFQEFAIYLALTDIPQGVGPEDSADWKNEGATVDVAGGNTANGVVQNITRLRELTGMRTGHSVTVQSEGAIYVFSEGSEAGVKPFAPGIGSWIRSGFISLANVARVFTQYDSAEGDEVVCPLLHTIINFAQAGNVTIIDDSGNAALNITFDGPCIVRRIAAPFVLSSFEVTPLSTLGGGHVFEDSTGTALPTRNVAKAGAGIEFEDDAVGEMTVVKLKEYIQPISFAITDTFTFKPAYNLSITSADVSANISDLRVGKNGATPTTITYPYPIIASDVLTFEVSFTDAYNRELSSFITLKGQYV